jgi:hypothetical protein
MKVLWTLLKVVLLLVVALPLAIIVLGTVLGIFGALLGLAILALKVVVVGALAYGAFKLLARLLRGPAPSAPVRDIPRVAPADRHYEAALRELDRELGDPVR